MQWWKYALAFLTEDSFDPRVRFDLMWVINLFLNYDVVFWIKIPS